MTRPDDTTNLPEERTMRTSRVFAAAPKMLWELFENPVELASWWGPSGFSNTFETFDFRSGGVWRFTMHGPDGSSYAMEKIFVTIRDPDEIVLDHNDPVHGFRMFMHFNETNAGTRLDWTMVFDHADEAAKVRPFVEPANEQNLDRLAARLNTRLT